VLVALANGKRSIVVPRLQRFREAVDDHQAIFARRLHDAGLVYLVENPRDLGDVLRHPPTDAPVASPNDLGLAEELHAYLSSALHAEVAAR
jgi:UDP-N-acetylglucosamine transferase subunit ALG13